jgi:integrase
MTAETTRRPRRSRGEGGLSWDAKRQRFVASATVGWTPAGKRIVRRGIAKTEKAARERLRERVREYEAGLSPHARFYTVRDAIEDWLTYGLTGTAATTVDKCTSLCRTHIIPHLGARKLGELTATDVDRWLADRAAVLSTNTLRELHQCLSRALNRAMKREYVTRNVVSLCTVPRGREGRRSKSLTFIEAQAVLVAAQASALYAYVVLSLLIGARTEELRALRWDHVDLDGTRTGVPSIQVWRSDRDGGDTKTEKSRRTLALPRRCIEALRLHRVQQDARRLAGGRWTDTGLVFTTKVGTELDAANVRREFRRVVQAARLDPTMWTPRELRHSFVSLLSAHGATLEQIADLAGHSETRVTETVYRHELRPVILHGATLMDEIFADTPGPDPSADESEDETTDVDAVSD